MNISFVFSLLLTLVSCNSLADNNQVNPRRAGKEMKVIITDTIADLYNRQIQHLIHNRTGSKWPVQTEVPLPGSILPYKRIISYYGNLYSSRMGILGELPADEMLKRLDLEVKKWEKADSLFPVQPALHYIAVTAQSSPGASRKYRLRMPDAEIDKVLQMAQGINAIVFLDIQVGLSTLQEEIPMLDKYLRLPHVHLGIDPEYSMKDGRIPCTTIGTFDAADINYAAGYLAGLVQQYQLPPKLLVVHRFTQAMVTNYKMIKLRPEVQIVMNMDGFGSPAKKIDSYKGWIAGQPVQYTGFKLFYKNDVSTGRHLMEPEEILQPVPSPCIYTISINLNILIMENKHICQSCSMPIDSIVLAGTEADGSPTWEYCIYCYKNGAFTKPDITLDEMKAFIQAEMKIQHIPEKISQTSLNSLADLKRWKLSNTGK